MSDRIKYNIQIVTRSGHAYAGVTYMPYEECNRVIHAAQEDDSEVVFDCVDAGERPVKIHIFHGTDIGALIHLANDEPKITRPVLH